MLLIMLGLFYLLFVGVVFFFVIVGYVLIFKLNIVFSVEGLKELFEILFKV